MKRLVAFLLLIAFSSAVYFTQARPRHRGHHRGHRHHRRYGRWYGFGPGYSYGFTPLLDTFRDAAIIGSLAKSQSVDTQTINRLTDAVSKLYEIAKSQAETIEDQGEAILELQKEVAVLKDRAVR